MRTFIREKFNRIIKQPAGIYLPHDAKKWIEEWLKPKYNGLEFGSGFSTIWFSQRVNSLITVESKSTWDEMVRALIKRDNITNVEYIYEPNLKKYPYVIDDRKNKFDFVFIDGRERKQTIITSYKRVKLGGILIIDNTDTKCYKSAFKYMNSLPGWEREDYRGLGINPKNGNETGPWQTSIWIRKT